MSSQPRRATPMLRQYFEMKSRAPDAILFYRMGDFYEMFFEDAREAAPLLGIALTARHRDSDIEAPMCGVPFHSADHHIARLVAAGRKVAVCDQVEDPRSAKGLVRRDITRIVTPGTVLDPDSLLPAEPSYLAAVVPDDSEAEVALLDLSTGLFQAGRVPASRLNDLFALFRPREVLLPEGAPLPATPGAAETRRTADWFAAAAGPEAARGGDGTAGGRAASAALAYARELRPNALVHVRPAAPLRFGERMSLDASALATLEVFESSEGEVSRSLFAILDRTRTPLGARSLRGALSGPSTDPMELEARWDAVAELVVEGTIREDLQKALDPV
ncbi:MAG TPA: DNA mismatch repair protein MutS, partial [Thermoanaerobaculia bacterium]|nr:DNA mismatch repair protein MutS [Thermoanaerobaculia bacterium]